MSLNAALNATVALIEGRTDIAKEIIRQPGSDVQNVPEILARLDRAVDRAAVRAIRNMLIRTLAIKCPTTIRDEEEFYLGVTAVEDMLEEAIKDMEA